MGGKRGRAGFTARAFAPAPASDNAAGEASGAPRPGTGQGDAFDVDKV